MILEALLTEIGSLLTSGQTVLSVAAAISTAAIEAQVADGIPVVRAMPNAPATVHEGIAGICAGAHASDEHLALAEECLSHLGAVVRLPERYMDAAPETGLLVGRLGHLALLAEAMIEAGILLGLSREILPHFVVQTMLGSADSCATEMHPVELRDASPRPAARPPRHPRAGAGRRTRRVPQRHPGGHGAVS